MNKRNKLLAMAVCLIVGTVAYAAPITYEFFQGGYNDGAFVSGTIQVEDVNNDDIIFYFNDGSDPSSEVDFLDEVLDFSFQFSGNSDLVEFSIDSITGLNAFSYDLNVGEFLGDGLGFLGLGEFIIATNFSEFYFSSTQGTVATNDLSSVSFTSELLELNVVSDSGSTLSLLGLGMIIAISFTERKRLQRKAS